MEMIKSALSYLVGLGAPNIQTIEFENGGKQMFTDKSLSPITPHIPKANSIEMSTLTSLVDYIKNGVDVMSPQMIVDVVSPTQVKLYSQLDIVRERELLVEVKADIPEICFGNFLDQEAFVIGLQAKFIPTDERDLVLKFAGTVEDNTVAQYSDDGVTQKATVKSGIASKEEAIVPNPVLLQPYRTFHEVEQPASQFIFRMKQGTGHVRCALFEADGGAWKNKATRAVKEFLQEELKSQNGFIVIS